jgi:hypothetical protein
MGMQGCNFGLIKFGCTEIIVGSVIMVTQKKKYKKKERKYTPSFKI